jgi:DNA-binding HxlR family transcriptional regulator
VTLADASDGDVLEPIEGRWTLHILLCLREGAHRFSDLRSAIPRISSNVLTERMRTLEHAGLVERQYLPPPSASHVYALARSAAGLKPALDALASWRAAPSPPFGEFASTSV